MNIAQTCNGAGTSPCLHYAFSSWSGGAFTLLALILGITAGAVFLLKNPPARRKVSSGVRRARTFRKR